MLLIIVAIAVVAVFSGMQLARSNSDITCTKTVDDQGACTNGSWGSWSTVSSVTDGSGSQTIEETRTYTGVRNIISGSFSISGNIHSLNYCNLGDGSYAGASGSITSQYSACQINETRTRVVASGSGGGGGGSSTVIIGTVISDLNSETTGDMATSTQFSGTFSDYQNMIDARLATSSIYVLPSIVRSGDPTHVIWTSDHVKSCTVSGTNGDAWSGGASASTGELSQPITTLTTFTLTCKTALGTTFSNQATVGIIPTYQEL
jgi:hypothetical protein